METAYMTWLDEATGQWQTTAEQTCTDEVLTITSPIYQHSCVYTHTPCWVK